MRVIESNEAVNNVEEIIQKEKEAKNNIDPDKVSGGINDARRRCTISDEMKELLILQLRHELANYNIYMSFAVYFGNLGFSKLVEYWEGRAKEEHKHHQWILNYLYECNAKFEYPGISSSEINIPDKIFPFKFTVDREIETTGMIYNLVNKSVSLGDWATFSFLIGDDVEFGKLVIEQREEEHLSREVLKIAQSDTDWLSIQDSIHERYFKN